MSQKEQGPIHRLVVGLGNPGVMYARTRHNLGFRALDAFLQAEGIPKRFIARGRARMQDVEVEGIRVLLVRPATYMNLSGAAVAQVLESTGLGLENLLVVHDEMDLEVGKAKMKAGGGAAGHRGVEDIIAHCGEGFARLKIGIGSPPQKGEDAGMEWVLGEMGPEEKAIVAELMPLVAQGMRRWAVERVEKAMSWFNSLQREVPEQAEVPAGELEDKPDE
jgi:PTH1 family peptidyl-tRNA hydrolase